MEQFSGQRAAIAQQMRHLRKTLGWSAERLSEELRKVGTPLDRSAIAKMESAADRGQAMRSISVEELLSLALVLGVAPVHLLVPPTDDGSAMRAWVRGDAPMPGQDPRRYFSEVPESEWRSPR